MMTVRPWYRFCLRTLAVGALILAGCDDPPTVETPAPPELELDLRRIVFLGNSITAGYQSLGINDSTQAESYAVAVTAAAQRALPEVEPLTYPTLAGTGCAPPIVNIFTGTRVRGGSPLDCAGRSAMGLTHNLAVPSARVIDLLANDHPRSQANLYTELFLEGHTQLSAAARLAPTFLVVWIGSNDVLAAALDGSPSAATRLDTFRDRVNTVVAAIDAIESVTGVLLIGVPKVTSIPHFSPGAAYWAGAQEGSIGPPVVIADNCAPAEEGGVGESTLVPFGYGFGVVLAHGGVLNCRADGNVLSEIEVAQLEAAVAGYDTTLSRAAAAQGWAYWDPNPMFDSLRLAGDLPQFPTTSGAEAVTAPFGRWFSRDGIHPNGAGHALIADHVIEALNAHYGTDFTR